MISIIGAGPCGSQLAYLLSREGEKVSVFEEHQRIGSPVQCTGIISEEIYRIAKPDENSIINKSGKARVFSESGNYASLSVNENIIVDRRKFDRSIAEKAESEGAKFHLNSRFEGMTFEKSGLEMKIRNKKGIKAINTEMLVGADGPSSSVARAFGLFRRSGFLTGTQIVTKYKNENFIDFFLLKKGIGWIVPLDEKTARIGVAFERDSGIKFNAFLRRVFGKSWRNSVLTSTEKNAGLIPLFSPFQKIQKGNVFLLGDSARQVKATTFGGIVPGLKAAKILSRSILEKKSYSLMCAKELFPDLYASLVVRKILNRCNEQETEEIIKILGSRRMNKLIGEKSRDRMFSLGLNALLEEPRLIYFLKNAF
ncbi:MAG: NAD(P)/FAD-dependent oxidoreductase [Candidatus Woesearchaeota archaeon]|nr:NAD(P)/FAD-dependent oxidoreductase [Candidatus Woesearchaeota archaeon]